jgi:hypothetical protein
MRHLHLSLLALAMAAACSATASATSIVTNGNFQSGSLAGWSIDTHEPWTVGDDNGNFYASTGCVGIECIQGNAHSQESFLSQVLTTVAGDSYTLTFDYSQAAPGHSGGTPNQLEVDFDGADVVNLVNLTNTSPLTYSFTVLATSNATELMFLGEQNPSFDYLDNISVTLNSTATPEPETFALVGTGLLGLAGAVRRKFSA